MPYQVLFETSKSASGRNSKENHFQLIIRHIFMYCTFMCMIWASSTLARTKVDPVNCCHARLLSEKRPILYTQYLAFRRSVKLAERRQALAPTSRNRADMLGRLSHARNAGPCMSTARRRRETLRAANRAGHSRVTSPFKLLPLAIKKPLL